MNNITLKNIANLLLIFGISLVLFASLLRVTNFGYINLSGVGANSLIIVDGNQVDANNLRLKSGTHQVVVFNKNSSNYANTLTVGRFKSTKPAIKVNSPSERAVETLSAWKWGFTTDNLREITQKDNYIVGGVSQGSVSPFVLEYDNGWRVLYFNNSSFISNRDLIPPSILPLVKGIETKYADR